MADIGPKPRFRVPDLCAFYDDMPICTAQHHAGTEERRAAPTEEAIRKPGGLGVTTRRWAQVGRRGPPPLSWARVLFCSPSKLNKWAGPHRSRVGAQIRHRTLDLDFSGQECFLKRTDACFIGAGLCAAVFFRLRPMATVAPPSPRATPEDLVYILLRNARLLSVTRLRTELSLCTRNWTRHFPPQILLPPHNPHGPRYHLHLPTAH